MPLPRLSHRALPLALLLALAGLPAEAQQPSRKGFWVGAALGGGLSAEACNGCPDQRTLTGMILAPRFGWGVSERLTIGLEASVWISGTGALSQKSTGETRRLNLALLAEHHPRPNSGLHLDAGIALAGYAGDYPPLLRSAYGPGLLLGVGWTLPVGRELYLDPALGIAGSYLGAVTEENQQAQHRSVARHASDLVVSLGIAFRFHPARRA
jgi:hypothetical protein